MSLKHNFEDKGDEHRLGKESSGLQKEKGRFEIALKCLGDRLSTSWANLTIEPAMLLYSFASSLSGSTSSQLLIYKSCRVDFNQTDATCQNLFLPENKPLNDDITDKVRYIQQWSVWRGHWEFWNQFKSNQKHWDSYFRPFCPNSGHSKHCRYLNISHLISPQLNNLNI